MDIKNTNYSDEVNEMLKDLNLDGELRTTPSKKLEKGDEFEIVRQRRLNDNPIENGFVPLVFETSNGAIIGTKHFVKIDGYEGRPIGQSVADACAFLADAKANHTVFTVEKVRTVDQRPLPGAVPDADGKYKDSDLYPVKEISLSC